eukprot:CAMPEP_0182941132 /NCGR_PEP_ID=MMETSP0105_2-20130417/48475_1 /TAXON_ID=81532 ORGANISM="Acanthoeca-like sp., Strain 10tr" /NCGR_SAMPLE_ID=MMETSP0105_2 /ASSEMBLY_ACC=CAM_ASM_000205 /LENGTH=62 /DNA_ID=CAMNT_0025080723 /DNA_START=55 /DNA_END=240 /DNA_ORIENTATION=+
MEVAASELQGKRLGSATKHDVLLHHYGVRPREENDLNFKSCIVHNNVYDELASFSLYRVKDC